VLSQISYYEHLMGNLSWIGLGSFGDRLWLNLSTLPQLEHLLVLFSGITSIVHFLGIICAAHAVMNVRSSRGAIAWTISLLTFPWVALPLYLTFGRRRFYGYREAVRLAYWKHRRTVRQVYQKLSHYQVPPINRLSGFHGVIDHYLPISFLRGNQIQLLIDGEEAYQVMLDAIEQAESYILLQVYIVHDDAIGNRLQQMLIAKAQKGVKVSLLYDGIGSQDLPRQYKRSLQEAGVTVEVFKSSRGLRKAFQLNFRNHRKILIVDGEVGFTGGFNVGDEYLGKNPRLSPWRDTAVMLQGPIVHALQTVFLSDWQWVAGRLPQVNWTIKADPSPEAAIACIFPTGPANDLSICKLAFVSAIGQAKERLWIASPYFVPDDAVMTALQIAAMRGVDVRILLPNHPDHLLVYLCSFSYYTEMLGAGVKIYRYIPGFMHQKVMLIDDILAGVGTVNLDNRSFTLNFEVTVWVQQFEFVQTVAAMLTDDFAVSRLVHRQEYEDRSLIFRLSSRIARLFAAIL
jgi:cardiolipin synthase A/B